jgi:hypothetical protein
MEAVMLLIHVQHQHLQHCANLKYQILISLSNILQIFQISVPSPFLLEKNTGSGGSNSGTTNTTAVTTTIKRAKAVPLHAMKALGGEEV